MRQRSLQTKCGRAEGETLAHRGEHGFRKTSDGFCNENNKFQFFVKVCIGSTLTFSGSESDTVTVVKIRLAAATSLHPDEMRLIFGGKFLEDWGSLCHYGVTKHSTLYLTWKLKGGMKNDTETQSDIFGPGTSCWFYPAAALLPVECVVKAKKYVDETQKYIYISYNWSRMKGGRK